MNRMILVFLIVLSVSPGCSGMQGGSEIRLEQRYEGSLEIVQGQQPRILSGRFAGSDFDCIAVVEYAAVRLFQVRDDTLDIVSRNGFEYEQVNFAPDVPPCAAGDLNGDGIDELVIFSGKTVRILERNGENFISSEVKFPYYVYDCIAGDLNNNGNILLVAACLSEPVRDRPDRAVRHDFRIVVADRSVDGFDMLYDRTEDVDMEIGTARPPDRFAGFADYDNTGSNRLLIAAAQSDVSPARYRAYRWQSGLFTAEEVSVRTGFSVENGEIPLTGRIRSFLYGGKTLLAGTLLGSDPVGLFPAAMNISGGDITAYDLREHVPGATYNVSVIPLSDGLLFTDRRPGDGDYERLFFRFCAFVR